MNLIKIVTLVFASIVVYEVFLQNSPFSSGITPMIYDEDIGMWHKRNTSHYLIKDCYKNKYFFDNIGRIKNNYQYNNVKKDVVIIGDSQIEGLSVVNDKVIHNSLYKELDGKYNVLNYALAGTGPVQQLEILKHKVNLSNISTLLQFVMLENDLNDGDPNTLNATNRPKVHLVFESMDKYKVIRPKPYDYQEKLRDFIGNFELYVYLKKTFNYYKKILLDDPIIPASVKLNQPPFLNNNDYKWQQLKGAIYQTNKLAKEYDFKYIIAFLSSFEKRGFIQYRSKFEKFLEVNDIDNINIVPYLNSLESKQTLGYSCDGHWNKNTHQELAKYLRNNIVF